jgi:ADP-ribose pyrophosphatase
MKKNRVVFKGKLLNLSVRHERLPNGYLAHLEVITHPGAALIVPLASKDKVILLRQYRPVINSYIYELPAGTLDKGERPLACAKREIIEETGYSAKKMKLLGHIFPVPGYSTEKIYVFEARGLVKTERTLEEDEVIETLVLSKREIKKLFSSGRIVDAKTIAALAMTGWL